MASPGQTRAQKLAATCARAADRPTSAIVEREYSKLMAKVEELADSGRYTYGSTIKLCLSLRKSHDIADLGRSYDIAEAVAARFSDWGFDRVVLRRIPFGEGEGENTYYEICLQLPGRP